jgi:imidazolonepropionase-like amidohydrolase
MMVMADYDVVIRDGLIADGNGGTPYRGDVGIADGRVVAAGRAEGSADREIDAGARWSRRAGSTCTPTTTVRPPGTSGWRRPPGTG